MIFILFTAFFQVTAWSTECESYPAWATARIRPEKAAVCQTDQASALEVSRVRAQKFNDTKYSRRPLNSWLDMGPIENFGMDVGYESLREFAREYPSGVEFDATPALTGGDRPFLARQMDINGDGLPDLIRFGSYGYYQNDRLDLRFNQFIKQLSLENAGVFGPEQQDQIHILHLILGRHGYEYMKEIFDGSGSRENPNGRPVVYRRLQAFVDDSPRNSTYDYSHPYSQPGANIPWPSACIRAEELPLYKRAAQNLEWGFKIFSFYAASMRESTPHGCQYYELSVIDDAKFRRGVVINLGRPSVDRNLFWTQPILFTSAESFGESSLFSRAHEGQLQIYSQQGSFFQNSREINIFQADLGARRLSDLSGDLALPELKKVKTFKLRGLPEQSVLRGMQLTGENKVRIDYQVWVDRGGRTHSGPSNRSEIREISADGTF